MFTVQVSLGAIIQPVGGEGGGLNVDEGARESRSRAAAWRLRGEGVRHKHTLPWTVGGQDDLSLRR